MHLDVSMRIVITSDDVDTAAQMKQDVDVEGLMRAGREVRGGAGKEIIISAHPSDTVAGRGRLNSFDPWIERRTTVSNS